MGIGAYRHRVTVETPHAPTPDGHGGYTESWAPADPPLWDCAIAPATVRALERLTAGTSLATASHIIRGRFHPGVTTAARIRLDETPARVLLVVHVSNPDERDRETIALASELLTPTPAPPSARDGRP